MQITEKENIASQWFETLRNKICAEFEKIEEEYLLATNQPQITFQTAPKFTRKKWLREVLQNNALDDFKTRQNGGGGEMSVMKGNVFEKVGVNISTVFGEFSEEFRKQIPGTENSAKFFATGVSLVAHMASPLVPAVHMNTRFIHTEKEWFGGGADLNPMFEVVQDTADFHQAFKNACDAYDASLADSIPTLENCQNFSYESYKKNDPRNNLSINSSYEKFKKNCDEYFFIKHRGVARGVGGIFYDYLNSENPVKNNEPSSRKQSEKLHGNFNKDFEFSKNVGLAFLDIFPQLVRRNMLQHWTQEQREHQLKKRGLYAEFNLLYDRGTKFGLMTGGNPEAILMSLPPVAKWE